MFSWSEGDDWNIERFNFHFLICITKNKITSKQKGKKGLFFSYFNVWYGRIQDKSTECASVALVQAEMSLEIYSDMILDTTKQGLSSAESSLHSSQESFVKTRSSEKQVFFPPFRFLVILFMLYEIKNLTFFKFHSYLFDKLMRYTSKKTGLFFNLNFFVF